MIREVRLQDADDIQKICKDELGYDVDINTIKKQIKKLSMDSNHHIIAVYENEDNNRVIGFVHAEIYESVKTRELLRNLLVKSRLLRSLRYGACTPYLTSLIPSPKGNGIS